jgi:serine/threonine protein kinase
MRFRNPHPQVMPSDLHQLYRLSPYVKILPGQEVYDAANWQDQWILKDDRTGRQFSINGTISRFLLFFQQAATLESVFTKLQLTAETRHSPVREQLTDFLEQMLRQDVLIRNEDWRARQRIRVSDRLKVLEEEYQVLETFQQFPSHFVCRARSLKDGEDSVIKGLHLKNIPAKNRPVAIAKFANEFTILARAGQHPQICSCLAFDPVQHRALMPYYPGGTLEDRLRKQAVSPAEARTLWQQIVRIFAYLHEQRISHGDPHFDNLIHQPNGQLVLIDFTCAADLDTPPEHSGKSAKVLLTPPERIDPHTLKLKDDWRNTTRAEIYQLGIMGYYLLYGQYPFSGSTWNEVAEGILHQAVVWAPLDAGGHPIPAAWRTLLQKCMSREFTDRWEDAQVLLREMSSKG